MRLSGFAAICAAPAAMAGCSLPVEGLGANDAGGEDGGVDARLGTIFDALSGSDVESPALDSACPSLDASSPALDAAPPEPDAGLASLCADSGVIFCDDFENGSSAWKPQTTAGTVFVDTARAYRGAHSLHAQTNAVPGPDRPLLGAFFGHIAPHAWPLPLFVRMFVYLPSPVPPSVGVLVNVVENTSPYPGLQLNFRPPSGYLGGTAFNGLDTDWSSAGDLLPTDAWACVELEVEGPPTNVVHVFLSGAELPALQHALPANVPPLDVLNVGLGYYQASMQPQTEVWIDEVAVDGARIGCTR